MRGSSATPPDLWSDRGFLGRIARFAAWSFYGPWLLLFVLIALSGLIGSDLDFTAFRDGRHIGSWTLWSAARNTGPMPRRLRFIDGWRLEADGVPFHYLLRRELSWFKLDLLPAPGVVPGPLGSRSGHPLDGVEATYRSGTFSWFDRLYVAGCVYAR